ncbi:MAG: amino acid adenylation domain-containing protein [Gemmataceae bacterium]
MFKHPRLVHRRFERQAALRPDAGAVEIQGRRLSYRELNERANRVAHALTERGVQPDMPVALVVERSLEMVVGVLAILKAGGAYCPLDPTWPRERLAALLADTRPPVILTLSHLQAELPSDQAPALCLDQSEDFLLFPTENLDTELCSDSIAYLPFTSGSTGRPKGVAIRHGSIVRLICENDYADFGPDEVFLHLAPLAFDASTLEIWGALLHGSRLVIAPPGTPTLPELGRLLAESGITTLWLTAGLLHLMAQERLDDLAGLHQLLAGGDVLSPACVRRVRERFPNLRLINGYGPTEATTFACCHTVGHLPPDALRVPIGRPIAGTELLILDDSGQPADEGELYIGGDGLARGYWNQPELTAERFISYPHKPDARLYRTGDRVRRNTDGVLEFLGRLDNQVKIRGFRIEPGEVEAAFLRHPAVGQVAVVAQPDQAADKRLVAFVVPRGKVIENELRNFVSSLLPDFMVPTTICVVSELPLTPNGKVNRDRLRIIDRERAAAIPVDDAGPTVGRLRAIWQSILNSAAPDVPFFDAGGDSLLALRILHEIEKQFGRRLGLETLVQPGTLAGIAELLDHRAATAGRALVPLQPHGRQPPFFLVHPLGGQVMGFRTLAHRLGPDQPLYGLQSYSGDTLSIEEMAHRYLAEVRGVQRHGPYYLGGYSLGAFIALEMARQVGPDVALLAVIDDGPALLQNRPEFSPAELRYFLTNLPGWLGHRRSQHRGRFWRDTARKLRVWLRGSRRELDEVLDADRFSPLIHPNLQAHYRTLKRYALRPYTGHVTLFRARVQPLFGSHRPDLGWGEFARRVTVHVIPGDHEALITEPHVVQLADALSLALPGNRQRSAA